MSNYAKIKYFCTTNGDGIGTSIFLTGCPIHCKGCFNQNLWDPLAGAEITENTVDKILISLSNEHVNHLSILGGEPLASYNIQTTQYIVSKVREVYGMEKKIWIWTGYRYEDIVNNYAIEDKHYEKLFLSAILNNIDYLVDGEFMEDKKEVDLVFKGSSNQRIIDMKKTLAGYELHNVVIKED